MKPKKIVMTGGSGRFAQIFKKIKNKEKFYYPSKKVLNIKNLDSIEKYIKKIKPDYIIHCAALSRPMDIHDKNIEESISTNIIGTSNIVKVCSKKKIKLIYFSTNYVYEGKKGNYKEEDPVLPFNNYGLSKLGGECAVAMYKNSLILRIAMSGKPFLHKYAFKDVKSNFIYHEEVAKIIPKILDQKGVLNIGGKIQSIYDFAKETKKDVKKSFGRDFYPPNTSVNISKLKKIFNKK